MITTFITVLVIMIFIAIMALVFYMGPSERIDPELNPSRTGTTRESIGIKSDDLVDSLHF